MTCRTQLIADELNAIGIPANFIRPATDDAEGRVDIPEFPGLCVLVGSGYAGLACDHGPKDHQILLFQEFKMAQARSMIDRAKDYMADK